jgi:hypothetical protein
VSLIHNERIKLTASCLNTLGTTIVATGVIAPLVAIVLRFPVVGAISWGLYIFAAIAWLVLGTVPTFAGEAHSREIEGMTGFEIYALFGSPLLLLLWAVFIVWLTGLQDARDDRRRTPAE